METLAGRARDVQVVTKRRQEIKGRFFEYRLYSIGGSDISSGYLFYVNHQYSSYEVKNTIALKKAVV